METQKHKTLTHSVSNPPWLPNGPICIKRLIISPDTGTLILCRWPPSPHYGSPSSYRYADHHIISWGFLVSLYARLFQSLDEEHFAWLKNKSPQLDLPKQVIDDHGEHVPNLSVHDTNLSGIIPIKVGMIPIMVCMMIRANLRFKMQSWQQGLNWVVPSTHALWKDGFHPNGPRKRLSQAWLSDPLQKDYIQLNHPRAYPSYVDPLVQLLPIGCRCQYCSRSVSPEGYAFMILAFPRSLQVWGVCW